MTFFAWLAAGACLLGLPGRYHSRGAFIALLVVALGASSGLIFALASASTMPRGPNEVFPGVFEGLTEVLAVSDDDAFLIDPFLSNDDELNYELMRIRLDDMSVDRFPSDLGLISQAVAHDDYLAFTGTAGENSEPYVALLGPEGFVIAPGEFRIPPNHYFSVTLSPEGDGFVLVDTGFSPGRDGFPMVTTALGTYVATISALARDGSLSEREVLEMCDVIEADRACFSGADLHLMGRGDKHLAVARGTCEHLPGDTAMCPGALRFVPRNEVEVIGPQGIQARPMPANGSGHRDIYTVFGDEGPTVVIDWHTDDDMGHEFDFGGGASLRIASVDRAEAPHFGFVDDAVHFTRLRDGTPEAEAFVPRWQVANTSVLPSGESLVIINNMTMHYVRLDATTLERLEPPGMLASVRARLAVWGGKSWAFELLLMLALALMVLTWPLLVFLRGERFTRQRALSLASAVLVLAAVLTFKRLFML